ncbi:MAG: hypothetical protein ABI925_05735 [Verrucomicrobiota bacterium]
MSPVFFLELRGAILPFLARAQRAFAAALSLARVAAVTLLFPLPLEVAGEVERGETPLKREVKRFSRDSIWRRSAMASSKALRDSCMRCHNRPERDSNELFALEVVRLRQLLVDLKNRQPPLNVADYTFNVVANLLLPGANVAGQRPMISRWSPASNNSAPPSDQSPNCIIRSYRGRADKASSHSGNYCAGGFGDDVFRLPVWPTGWDDDLRAPIEKIHSRVQSIHHERTAKVQVLRGQPQISNIGCGLTQLHEIFSG